MLPLAKVLEDSPDEAGSVMKATSRSCLRNDHQGGGSTLKDPSNEMRCSCTIFDSRVV